MYLRISVHLRYGDREEAGCLGGVDVKGPLSVFPLPQGSTGHLAKSHMKLNNTSVYSFSELPNIIKNPSQVVWTVCALSRERTSALPGVLGTGGIWSTQGH